MTMTSELKKSKRGSIDRFFAPRLGDSAASSKNPLTEPISSSSLAPPIAQADDDRSTKKKSSKKTKLVPVVLNNKTQANKMVEEDSADDTENRLHTRKSKSAKRSVTHPPPPQKKVHLPPPTKKDGDDELLSSKAAKKALKQKLQEVKEEVPQVPQKPRGVRTFRIWHPNTKGKTLRVRVGPTGSTEVLAEEVFELKNIKAKTYEEWKREAKMYLPSATGGAAVENLGDVLNILPTVQKEADPKLVQNATRRLSLDSGEFDAAGNRRRKTSVSVKQPARSLPTVGPIDSDSSEEDEEDEDDDSAEDYTTIEIESDEDEEVAERKMARTDIKGKLQTLKELTENLSHKRVIRQQLVHKATGHTVLDAEDIPLKEHILYIVEYIGNHIHDMLTACSFWSKSIAEINGRYGVVVASYFIWLRRMIVLNTITWLLTLCIIIIPQIVEDQTIPNIHNHSGIPDFEIIDLIHGEHSLHHSYLFYSGYNHRNENSSRPFSNPAVRFLTVMVLVFLINVYYIFSLISTFYRGIRMETNVAGAAHNHHFVGIVCGWNFSCRDEQAALFLRKTIQRELHILANAFDEEEERTIRIKKQNKRVLSFLVKKFGLRTGTFVMHMVSSFLVCICCCILAIIMVSLCQVKLDYYLNCLPFRDDGESRQAKLKYGWFCEGGDLQYEVWIMALPALFIAVVTLYLNWIITIIGDMESWATTERSVIAKMFRAGLLYGTNLQVIYWFWEGQAETMLKEGFSLETIFAKELYRIVVIQGILNATINVAVRWLYHRINKRRDPLYTMSAFPTEHITLGMFFLHALALMGPLFSPGLGLLITIRLVLEFYRNRYSLFHFHSNDSYASHASSVYGPYLVTYFLTFLLTSFMNIYYMSETIPSQYEGPFVNYGRYDEALHHLFSRRTGLQWVQYLGKPGFLAGFLALLLALVYYNWQWSKAYDPIIEQLNDTIFLERADRETLLKAIFEIGKATRFAATAMPSTAAKLAAKAQRSSSYYTTDASASSAVPTSTEVSDAETKTSITSEKVGEFAKPSQEKQMQALRKLMEQVKVDQPENTTLTGLQKRARKSVTVDAWNSQRHRRDVMEKYVKGIVGSRRSARSGTLAYDPTSKIFKKKPNSSGTDSDSSNNSPPRKEMQEKEKKIQSNTAAPGKIAEKPEKPLPHLPLPAATKTASQVSVLSANSPSQKS